MYEHAICRRAMKLWALSKPTSFIEATAEWSYIGAKKNAHCALIHFKAKAAWLGVFLVTSSASRLCTKRISPFSLTIYRERVNNQENITSNNY